MLPVLDTIVALSTPPGRSGIGVIRLSGSRSVAITQILVADTSFLPHPNDARLRTLYDPANAHVLDEAIITFFKAPHSFTGEDVIELSCHGSPVLLRAIIDVALGLDARIADPGEFTLRALRHGKIDLTQAEAIRDLIDAQTTAAVLQANRQLSGEVSHAIRPSREQLIEVIVRLESSLEFVEDDLPAIESVNLASNLTALGDELSRLASTFSRGRLIRDGIRAAFLGRPNVGKSSLFNRLLAHDRAIVTETPGTTRDTLSESIDIDGVPVQLTDTAGVRDARDAIESMGVARTQRAVTDADLVVLVIDGSQDLTREDHRILSETDLHRTLVVLNKNDLSTFDNETFLRALNDRKALDVVSISAKTGAGVDDLRKAIMRQFSNGVDLSESLIITNARHHDLLNRAIGAISSSRALIEKRATEELVLVGLHNALRCLDEILGETTTDDILGRIFSKFCIGK